MTDEKRDLVVLKKRLQDKVESSKIGLGLRAVLGSAFIPKSKTPPSDRSTRPKDLQVFAQLRVTIADWRAYKEKMGESKVGRLMLLMGEQTIVEQLRHFVPDPQEGIADLAMSLLPTFLEMVLGKDVGGDPTIHMWDMDDEDKNAKFDEMNGLEKIRVRTEKDGERLAELHVELDDLMLCVPSELYKKAVERNQMAWMYKKAGEYGPEEKLDEPG